MNIMKAEQRNYCIYKIKGKIFKKKSALDQEVEFEKINARRQRCDAGEGS